MLKGGEDHVRAGDLGLVFFLVQRPVQLLRQLRDLPGEMRVAVLLDIAPAARILHADGAEHDQERGGGDPFLSMCEFRDLFDQAQSVMTPNIQGCSFPPEGERRAASSISCMTVFREQARSWNFGRWHAVSVML